MIQRRKQRGVTLIECVILVTVVSIVSLGFGIALQTSARTPYVVNQRLDIHTRIVEKMEDLSSLSFATLAANSGLSDNVTVGSTTYTRTVAVAYVDADGVSGVESDFLEVTVTINGQSLKTRVTKP